MKHLKQHINIALIAIAVQSVAYGKANVSDPLSDAEKVRTLSQDIAKNYFYIEQGIQASSAKKALKNDLLRLDSITKKLKEEAKDPETQKIAEFMTFSEEEMNDIIKDEFNQENGGMVLDYTETLLEGSENIVNKDRSKVETMSDVINEMSFLLERASKYYIAFRAGYTDDSNVMQAQKAVKQFDILMKRIKAYNYPDEIKNGPVKKLLKYWPVSKDFYLGIKKSDLPTIVFISTKHMKSALDKLAKYHQ
jgi:hypothetical protein